MRNSWSREWTEGPGQWSHGRTETNALLRRSAMDLAALEACARSLQRAEDEMVSVRKTLQDMVAEAKPDLAKLESPPQLRRERVPSKKSSSLHYEHAQLQTPMDNAAFNAFNGVVAAGKTLRSVTRGSSAQLKPKGFSSVSAFRDGEEQASIVWQRPCRFCPMPILHPEAPMRLAWLAPAFLFVLGEAFLVPFMLSFYVATDPDSVMGVAFRIIDVYFLMDILVTFFTGYRHKSGGLVLGPCRIARHYLTGWFVLDAIAAIPWSWIGESTAAQMTRSLKVVRLVRLARLLRLAKLRQITEAAETYMEGKYAAELLMGFGKVLLLLCAVSHWCACFWHAIGNEEGGWVAEIEKASYAGEDPMFVRYTWSLYFTLTTLTTVGYGDIKPETTAECRWVLLLLLTSAVIFSGLLGMLSDLVASINKEHRIVSHKKRVLARYMTWRAIPRNLLFKVRRYLLFRWGAQKDYDLYEEELKRTLTPTLRSELCYYIFKDVLHAAPFLGWMRGHKACIQQLATSCRSSFQDSGDFLFRAGDEVKDLYVLLAGSVFLYRRDGDAEKHADEHLGDQEYVLADWNNLATIRSRPRSRLQQAFAATVDGFGYLVGRLRRLRSSGSKPPNALASSSTHDLDSRFHGACYNESLLRGMQELKKQDTLQRQAAEFIQTVWREHKARQGVSQGGRHNPSGYPLDAPAYFGESSLWVSWTTWRSQAALHTYTVRCKTQVELICIPRLAIAACLEKFSPWLPNRFEIFQSAVLKDQASRVSSSLSPLSSSLSPKKLFHAPQRQKSSSSHQIDSQPGLISSWDKVKTLQVVPATSENEEDPAI